MANNSNKKSGSLDTAVGESNESSIPRGKPKSGRVWKTVRTQRHAAMKMSKSSKTSWETKMAKKQDAAHFKERIKVMKEQKAREKERERKMNELKKQRKLENKRKSEVVQVIKNTAKIKRMKKKHLKSIEIR